MSPVRPGPVWLATTYTVYPSLPRVVVPVTPIRPLLLLVCWVALGRVGSPLVRRGRRLCRPVWWHYPARAVSTGAAARHAGEGRALRNDWRNDWRGSGIAKASCRWFFPCFSIHERCTGGFYFSHPLRR